MAAILPVTPDADVRPLAGFLRRRGWLLIFLLALLLRWWGNGFGLPYIYTSDEAVTVNRAVRFGTGDLNPHWFNYGSLNMYFLFANYGIFYAAARGFGLVSSSEQFARLFIADPTGFYLIGRAWSGLWSALCVLWVFFLGRRWWGETAAWGAALLLAVNVATVENAHSVLNDPLMLFLMLWAVWECDGIRQWGGLRRYVRAGLAVGLAASTKYVPVLMFAALVVAHLQWLRGQALRLTSLLAWLPVVLAGACAAAGFLAGTPYAVLDLPTFLAYMAEWRTRGAAGLVFIPPDAPSSLALIFGEYLPAAMGWPALVLALLGALYALWRRSAMLAPYAVYALLLLLMLAGSKQMTPRYPLPFYPLLALFAAFAVAELAKFFARRGYRHAALVTGCGLLLAALTGPALGSVATDVELTLPDTRTQLKEWIEGNLPAESVVLMDHYSPPLAQSRRKLAELYARAVAEGHAKADKLRLQLLTLPPQTYAWYWIRYEKNSALPRDQQWSDAMLPYLEARGGVAAVRAQGVRYVVLSSFNRDAYHLPWLRTLYPELAAFYDQVEREAVLLRRCAPACGYAQGPRLDLYDLGTAP